MFTNVWISVVEIYLELGPSCCNASHINVAICVILMSGTKSSMLTAILGHFSLYCRLAYLLIPSSKPGTVWNPLHKPFLPASVIF